MIFQCPDRSSPFCHRSSSRERSVRSLSGQAACVFAVHLDGPAARACEVPEKARAGVGDRIGAVEGITSSDVARPQGVARLARLRHPLVAVPGISAGGVEVVEENELGGELAVIGRDVFTEHDERRIAVASGEISKQLIVGAVLLDDVHDVLDERGIAGAPGDRQRCRGPRLRRRQLLSCRRDAVVLGDRRAVAIELRGIRNLHDAHGPSVGVHVAPPLLLLIGSGTDSQECRDREPGAGVVQREMIGIPAGWNQPENPLLRHVHHGHGVEASERDKQRRAIGAHGQRGRRDPLQRQPERLEADGGGDLAGGRVDDRDRIGVGVRHEDPLARLVVRHRCRVQPDVNRVRHLQRVPDRRAQSFRWTRCLVRRRRRDRRPAQGPWEA